MVNRAAARGWVRCRGGRCGGEDLAEEWRGEVAEAAAAAGGVAEGADGARVAHECVLGGWGGDFDCGVLDGGGWGGGGGWVGLRRGEGGAAAVEEAMSVAVAVGKEGSGAAARWVVKGACGGGDGHDCCVWKALVRGGPIALLKGWRGAGCRVAQARLFRRRVLVEEARAAAVVCGASGSLLHLLVHTRVLWVGLRVAAAQRGGAMLWIPDEHVEDLARGRGGDDDVCGGEAGADDEKRVGGGGDLREGGEEVGWWEAVGEGARGEDEVAAVDGVRGDVEARDGAGDACCVLACADRGGDAHGSWVGGEVVCDFGARRAMVLWERRALCREPVVGEGVAGEGELVAVAQRANVPARLDWVFRPLPARSLGIADDEMRYGVFGFAPPSYAALWVDVGVARWAEERVEQCVDWEGLRRVSQGGVEMIVHLWCRLEEVGMIAQLLVEDGIVVATGIVGSVAGEDEA